MKAVMQYAIFKIFTTDNGFGNSSKALSISPVPEARNSGKLRIFSDEADARAEIEKLISSYSSVRYTIMPVYTDPNSI